jgi:HEAT repeat protein
MPGPDPQDKILKNVEEGQIERIAAELYAGGREAIIALVDMLTEPGGERNDSPVRHALHALVIHAGGLGDEQRQAVASALASTLNGRERSNGVRAFVVRQLQVCGGRESAAALGRLLRDEALYADGAMALLAVRDGAAEQFRAALSDVTGPQRVAAIAALGTLEDAESADALRRAAERDPDPVARLEAAWALANIGDSGSAEVVMRIADEAKGFERVRATKACLLLAENLAAAGRKQDAVKIYTHLRDTRSDPSEQYVRGVAARALGG